MQLKSLFLDRRSEPKILLVLKLVTMLMIIGYLVSYTTIIIIDVKQDAPIIRTSINYADAIRVPDIVFNCHYKFQIIYPSPLNPLSNFENSFMFFITMPMNNAVQVDREIRSNTNLGGLGLLGGAWTLAGALYAFLFGADMLNPWGVVQSYCFGISRRTRNQLKEAYKKKIPFFDTSKPDTKNNPSIHTLSLAEQNELLLARIDSLELLLQEYVVDVSYLDKVRQDKEIKTFNAISDSTRNSAANTTDINSMSSTASNTALNITQNSTNSNEGLV